MPLVSKCCCCCNLKYGYFTYGILCMMGRVCAITALYFIWPLLFNSSLGGLHHENIHTQLLLSTVGVSIGWFFATSIALFIALKGIVQERSILMFPYIVIMVLELAILIMTDIILAAVVTPWYILNAIIGGGINVYALLCLVSLYQHIKDSESRAPLKYENFPLKTV